MGYQLDVVMRVGIIGLTSGARFRLEIAYSGTHKAVEYEDDLRLKLFVKVDFNFQVKRFAL